jgi:hypothetical protein
MKLIEAAELILGESKGTHLGTKEICELAIQKKLITPKSRKPWVHMQAVLRQQLALGRTSDGKSKLGFDAKGWYLEQS